MIFKKRNVKVIMRLITLIFIFTITITFYNSETNKSEILNNKNPESSNKVELKDQIVFDGLTMKELAEKLDRTLSSDLDGYGYIFAEKSVELGLDPYLAVAITMHETGCKWGCSSLLRNCNNVAGIKGKPSCNGGSYKSFSSLEEGINYFLEMLYNKYYSKGLTTPEQINTKYAEDKTWYVKVNNYIENIKKA